MVSEDIGALFCTIDWDCHGYGGEFFGSRGRSYYYYYYECDYGFELFLVQRSSTYLKPCRVK